MLSCVVVGALSMLIPSVARAEAGEWLEGTLGLRRTLGTLSYTNNAIGVPGTITLDDRVDGSGLALAGRAGYAGSKYWAVGLGLGVTVASFDENHFSGADIDIGLFTTLSIDARFRPLGNGFFVGPSLGYTRLGLAGGKDDFGSPDNIFEEEVLYGPEVALVTGWTEGPFGVEVELGYQHLEAEHTKYHPLFVGVSFVVQQWDLD